MEVLEHSSAGKEVNWAGEILAVVAAESEGAAREGVAALKNGYQFEVLEDFTADDDLEVAQKAKRVGKGGTRVATENEAGDDDECYEKEFVWLFEATDVVHEGGICT